MQDAFHVALTIANCLPRLQVSLSLLWEVPAFLKGADCSLWQAQRSNLLSPGEDHRNPHKRRLLWSTVASPGGSLVPSSTSVRVPRAGGTFLLQGTAPDRQQGDRRLPAASGFQCW